MRLLNVLPTVSDYSPIYTNNNWPSIDWMCNEKIPSSNKLRHIKSTNLPWSPSNWLSRGQEIILARLCTAIVDLPILTSPLHFQQHSATPTIRNTTPWVKITISHKSTPCKFTSHILIISHTKQFFSHH